MMQFSRGELAFYARILNVVCAVAIVVYLLSGAAIGVVAAGILASRGYAVSGLLFLFGGLFMGALAGMLVVAPLKLAIEVSLCASRIEENTAQLVQQSRNSEPIADVPTGERVGAVAIR